MSVHMIRPELIIYLILPIIQTFYSHIIRHTQIGPSNVRQSEKIATIKFCISEQLEKYWIELSSFFLVGVLSTKMRDHFQIGIAIQKQNFLT